MIAMIILMGIFSLHQLPASEEAVCSWYGQDFHGQLTSCGEVFDMYEYTAAHRSLPIGTVLAVESDRARIRVIVNDAGPFVDGRDIDLSMAAYKRLAPCRTGVKTFKYVILGYEVRDTMRYNLRRR